MTSAARHFSGTYGQARARFLAAASEAGARLTHRLHPLKGPDGEIATDVARIGPASARKILGIGSGTHGVEGFCGSGVETALLASGFAKNLPADTALVFIHAINPWGFAWGRRVNEDNVDLNRNFLDHEKPRPENPGYDAIYDAVNPKELSEAALAEGRAAMKAYAEAHGPAALQHALTAGQYTYPEGVQYGGQRPVWSNATLRDIIRGEMRAAERIVYIDIHSGLGARGHGEVICTAPETSDVYKRMHGWWGDIVHSTRTQGSVSSDVPGSITEAFTQELPDREVTPCGLEFGTIAMNAVAAALVADNWLHRNGGMDNPMAPAIKKQIRDAFYVDEDDWKEAVTTQTRTMAARALEDF
ncbi:MAG: M14 family metallopeptidase [Parvibaculum sp.]|uniref:M14 family metallopeptidase n=1 Tax=Parvibaculum sp. TaxID=2024848 RepID=UPI0025CBC659|nr:M14 family metallopeptidase [Parvibaculum sp.]MCE9648600.1 M14 family metallopeptidase [Parvibaculum sp.]